MRIFVGAVSGNDVGRWYELGESGLLRWITETNAFHLCAETDEEGEYLRVYVPSKAKFPKDIEGGAYEIGVVSEPVEATSEHS